MPTDFNSHDRQQFETQLSYLKLNFIKENYETFSANAGRDRSSHLRFLASLVDAEAKLKEDKTIARRVRQARLPVIKTLDQFDWSWPKKINRLQIQNLFRLKFLDDHANVVFLGKVGLGKTHLSTALAYQACLKGHSVLFTSAVDAVNCLTAARSAGKLKHELRRYLAPKLLVLDELGYLPIDKTGADLLFQIISKRYELGSLIITTNRAYKHWASIFNNDATLTSALLDRLLHHTETVQISGPSYRQKDRLEEAEASEEE